MNISSNANETLNASTFNLHANNDSTNDNVNIGSTLTCLNMCSYAHRLDSVPYPLGKTNNETPDMLVGRKMRRRRSKTRLR